MQLIAALFMGIIVYICRQLGESNVIWITEYNSIFVVTLVGLGAAVYFTILLSISSKFRTTIINKLSLETRLFN